jgi:hypothetical protein
MGWLLLVVLLLLVFTIGVAALGRFTPVETATLFGLVSAFGAMLTALQMRLDTIERTRPRIVVDVEITGSQLIHLRLRNIGEGLARRVSLAFNPVPLDYEGRQITTIGIWGKPIPVLGPGEEKRHVLGHGPKLRDAQGPKRFEVTARYRGVGRWSSYSERFEVDLEQHLGMTVPLKTLEEHLPEMVRALQRLNDVARALQSIELDRQTGDSPVHSVESGRTYHVYENWTAEDKAIIHFSDCGYCNEGHGIHDPARKTEGKHGRWHGPFDTYAEALKAATRTGRENVRGCKACRPH